MKPFLLLLIPVFIFSCISSKRYQTISYDMYASKHRKLAIVPVEVEGRVFKEKVSQSNQIELLAKEQKYINDVLFQKIIKRTGRDKNDIKIELMSNYAVLDVFSKSEKDPLEISKMSNKELALLLGVDAILRTKVNTKILLHSYEDDIMKEVLRGANVFLGSKPILSTILNTDLHPINITAEIIDAESESVIWSYHKLEKLEVAEKHNDVLNDICKDIAMRLPYREKR